MMSYRIFHHLNTAHCTTCYTLRWFFTYYFLTWLFVLFSFFAERKTIPRVFFLSFVITKEFPFQHKFSFAFQFIPFIFCAGILYRLRNSLFTFCSFNWPFFTVFFYSKFSSNVRFIANAMDYFFDRILFQKDLKDVAQSLTPRSNNQNRSYAFFCSLLDFNQWNFIIMRSRSHWHFLVAVTFHFDFGIRLFFFACCCCCCCC